MNSTGFNKKEFLKFIFNLFKKIKNTQHDQKTIYIKKKFKK